MGGKSDKVTTTQENDPWAPSQGALKDILGRAGNLFGTGQEQLLQRQAQGNPLYGQSKNALNSLFTGSGPLANLSNTAEGDFLDVTNSPTWGSMTGGIQDAVNSQFSMAGRTGSPAHQGVMTSELGKLAGQLYGQERQNQLSAGSQLGGFMGQAIGAAPGTYEFGNADLNSLWQNLSRYGGLAQGIGGMGGTATGTQEQEQSLLSQITGLLSAGAGAYKSIWPGGK